MDTEERRKKISECCLQALSEERRIPSFDGPQQLKILALTWNQAVDNNYSTGEKILVAQKIVKALKNVRIP